VQQIYYYDLDDLEANLTIEAPSNNVLAPTPLLIADERKNIYF
jgi:hypothetical protein